MRTYLSLLDSILNLAAVLALVLTFTMANDGPARAAVTCHTYHTAYGDITKCE
jgi:hypothetical protein